MFTLHHPQPGSMFILFLDVQTSLRPTETRRVPQDSPAPTPPARGPVRGSLIPNNSVGISALHIAVRGGHIRIAEVLLVAGANPLVKDRAGNTPMDVAADASPLVRFGANTVQRWVDRM